MTNNEIYNQITDRVIKVFNTYFPFNKITAKDLILSKKSGGKVNKNISIARTIHRVALVRLGMTREFIAEQTKCNTSTTHYSLKTFEGARFKKRELYDTLLSDVMKNQEYISEDTIADMTQEFTKFLDDNNVQGFVKAKFQSILHKYV